MSELQFYITENNTVPTMQAPAYVSTAKNDGNKFPRYVMKSVFPVLPTAHTHTWRQRFWHPFTSSIYILLDSKCHSRTSIFSAIFVFFSLQYFSHTASSMCSRPVSLIILIAGSLRNYLRYFSQSNCKICIELKVHLFKNKIMLTGSSKNSPFR